MPFDTLKTRLDSVAEGWDRRWEDQVESYFDVRTSILPWRDCRDDEACGKLIAGPGGFADAFPGAFQIRQLAAAMPDQDRPFYDQNSAGSWQAKVELSARLMQALRAIRHVPVPPEWAFLVAHSRVHAEKSGAVREKYNAIRTAGSFAIQSVRVRI